MLFCSVSLLVYLQISAIGSEEFLHFLFYLLHARLAVEVVQLVRINLDIIQLVVVNIGIIGDVVDGFEIFENQFSEVPGWH